MAAILFEGFRFEEDEQLSLYKMEGEEKGMFKFPKPILKAEVDDVYVDKAVSEFLKVMATVVIKKTFIKAFKKDDNGNWAFCDEVEGKAKGEWGGNQSAEAKARGSQDDSEPGEKDKDAA